MDNGISITKNEVNKMAGEAAHQEREKQITRKTKIVKQSRA